MSSVLLESRPYRPFKSSEEYLEAMREDLAEWLNTMYPELMINPDNFMDRLDTGVVLCKHANNVRQAAEDYLARRQARNKSMTRSMTSGLAGPILAMGNIHYLPAAKSGTFFARDNVSNFITWCRKSLRIFECLLFETDDLIMRKNEKHVILCLLEVARRGAKFGMLAPMLVQMERQIDREIAADNKANGIACSTQTDFNNGANNMSTEADFDTDTEDEDDEGPMLMYGPQPQIITNDLKSLDEMVRDLVEKCTCPSQFPMIRVSEGKYRIGDTKVLIFVRILRSHVMVRVGGGWDTLSHYLDKHDPCRCRAQHRSALGARLIPRTNNQTNGIELHKAHVVFERSPPVAKRIVSNSHDYNTGNHLPSGGTNTLSPSINDRGRSRSPTPHRKHLNNTAAISQNNSFDEKLNDNSQFGQNSGSSSPNFVRRPVSPSPKRFVGLRKKQLPPETGISPCSTNTTYPGLDFNSHVHFENSINESNKSTTTDRNNSVSNNGSNSVPVEGSTKFENISDNGSEISDEGYRSLGVIHSALGSNAHKGESLQSQGSVEDAEKNVRINETSSDSQLSSVKEQSSSNTISENLESNCIDQLDSSQSMTPSPPEEKDEQKQTQRQQDQEQPTHVSSRDIQSLEITEKEPLNNFAQSGVFITDNEITVDIASATGLRKTGFSDKIYGNDEGLSCNSLKKISSNIPRSPKPTRRRSVDNSSDCGLDFTARTGLPVLNRKQPVYRSVRKLTSNSPVPAETEQQRKEVISRGKEVTNTWSGRSATTKKRPTIGGETFTPPAPSSNFSRNSKGRSSAIVYDSNGRRVRGGSTSLTTSPIKNSSANSPLAQQLLEAAGNAKSDAQILEKMKQLLTQYSSIMNSNNPNKLKNPDYDDFTSAWVHSNGNLDRSSTCSPPAKGYSKRNSAASSTESTHSKDMSAIISSRKDRGLSRIPAPVRNHTELY